MNNIIKMYKNKKSILRAGESITGANKKQQSSSQVTEFGLFGHRFRI